MNLNDIQEMWKVDSVIDQVMLDEASIKIHNLHSKYISLHNEQTLLLKKAEQELRKAQHQKWLYYSGKYVPEDSEPFPYKVIKSDVLHWVQVDDVILKIESKIDYYNVTLKALDDILKQIHQMSYSIGNAIKWRIFCQGG